MGWVLWRRKLLGTLLRVKRFAPSRGVSYSVPRTEIINKYILPELAQRTKRNQQPNRTQRKYTLGIDHPNLNQSSEPRRLYYDCCWPQSITVGVWCRMTCMRCDSKDQVNPVWKHRRRDSMLMLGTPCWLRVISSSREKWEPRETLEVPEKWNPKPLRTKPEFRFWLSDVISRRLCLDCRSRNKGHKPKNKRISVSTRIIFSLACVVRLLRK